MEKTRTITRRERIEQREQVAKKRLFAIRLVTTCVFMTVALTLYLLNFLNLPGVLLILCGALWNFFVDINTFTAFLFSVLVGVLFASFSVLSGLYINGVLYIFYYIPLQFSVYIMYMNEKNMSIKRNRKLKGQEIYYVCVAFVLVFAVCFALAIMLKNQILPVFDALTACLLGLSAFLQSNMFREYYIVRPIALLSSIGLFVYAAYINGMTAGIIAIIMLYSLYFILDLASLYFWLDVVDLPSDRQLSGPDSSPENQELVNKKLEQYAQAQNKDQTDDKGSDVVA